MAQQLPLQVGLVRAVLPFYIFNSEFSECLPLLGFLLASVMLKAECSRKNGFKTILSLI